MYSDDQRPGLSSDATEDASPQTVITDSSLAADDRSVSEQRIRELREALNQKLEQEPDIQESSTSQQKGDKQQPKPKKRFRLWGRRKNVQPEPVSTQLTEKTDQSAATWVSDQQFSTVDRWQATQRKYTNNSLATATLEEHFHLSKARQVNVHGVGGAISTTLDENIKQDAAALRDALKAYGKPLDRQTIHDIVGRNSAASSFNTFSSETKKEYGQLVTKATLERYAEELQHLVPQQRSATYSETKPNVDQQSASPVAVPKPKTKTPTDPAIQQKLDVLHSKDPEGYQGHDTAREYDKFVGREYERAKMALEGKKTPAEVQKAFRDRPKAVLALDRKAAFHLAEAGHSPESIRRVIASRSLRTKGLSPQDAQLYARQVANRLKEPAVQKRLEQSKQVRNQRKVPENDRRLQRMDVSKREHAINRAENIYSAKRLNDINRATKVRDPEIFRSNYKERRAQVLGESQQRVDIELSKPFLRTDSRKSVEHAGKIVGDTSPNAARQSYSPKKQREYGVAQAKKAYDSQDFNQRPERCKYKLSAERYAHSAAQYQQQRAIANSHDPGRER